MQCLDATQKKCRNLKRGIDSYQSFLRGWTSCYCHTKLLWRNPFHRNLKSFDRIQSCISKGRIEKFSTGLKKQNSMFFYPNRRGSKGGLKVFVPAATGRCGSPLQIGLTFWFLYPYFSSSKNIPSQGSVCFFLSNRSQINFGVSSRIIHPAGGDAVNLFFFSFMM
jgi:hypothetical protein